LIDKKSVSFGPKFFEKWNEAVIKIMNLQIYSTDLNLCCDLESRSVQKGEVKYQTKAIFGIFWPKKRLIWVNNGTFTAHY
jgi:hypothetical protein